MAVQVQCFLDRCSCSTGIVRAMVFEKRISEVTFGARGKRVIRGGLTGSFGNAKRGSQLNSIRRHRPRMQHYLERSKQAGGALVPEWISLFQTQFWIVLGKRTFESRAQ